jgi:hypothetical protein
MHFATDDNFMILIRELGKMADIWAKVKTAALEIELTFIIQE